MIELRQSLSDALVGLRAGERFWFWAASAVPSGVPPVLLQSFGDDPSMRTLKQQIASIPPEERRAQCLGAGNVNSSGVLCFGSPRVERGMLEEMAKYVGRWCTEHTSLARLRDAQLIKLDGAKIVEVVRDDSLWEEVPVPTFSGTMAYNARLLGEMAVGDRAWFWLTTRGPGGEPYLAFHPYEGDESVGGFVEEVKRLVRRSREKGPVIKGVAQMTDQGVVLTTEEPLEGWEEMLRLVVKRWGSEFPSLRQLKATRVVRFHEGKIEADRVGAGKRSAGNSAALKTTADALERLSESTPGMFWFTDSAETGAPLLLVDQDKTALMSRAKERAGSGRIAKGQVVVSKAGWLEFRTRDVFEGFVPTLARWAKAHAREAQSLKRLRGARMTCRDAEGNVVARERNDEAWK